MGYLARSLGAGSRPPDDSIRTGPRRGAVRAPPVGAEHHDLTAGTSLQPIEDWVTPRTNSDGQELAT